MFRYSPKSGHQSDVRRCPLWADFVAEVGFEGRVGGPRIFWPSEAIVLRQPRAEAAALRHRNPYATN